MKLYAILGLIFCLPIAAATNYQPNPQADCNSDGYSVPFGVVASDLWVSVLIGYGSGAQGKSIYAVGNFPLQLAGSQSHVVSFAVSNEPMTNSVTPTYLMTTEAAVIGNVTWFRQINVNWTGGTPFIQTGGASSFTWLNFQSNTFPSTPIIASTDTYVSFRTSGSARMAGNAACTGSEIDSPYYLNGALSGDAPSSENGNFIFQGTAGNASNPPSSSVLSGSNVGVHNILSWTPAAGATGGYNLTRCDLWGYCVNFTFGPSTYSYTDGAGTTNRSYVVRAWNSFGNGTVSNTIILRQGVQNLFDDSSGLYGGSRSNLAAALGVSSAAVGVLWGLLLIMLLTAGGWSVGGGLGAGMGALAGLLTAIAAGMWPIWAVFLLAAIAAAMFVLFRGKTNGA